MKRQRLYSILGVTAVLLILLFGFNVLTNDTRSYVTADTSVALQQLRDGNVKSAQIDDREQRVRLELIEPITVDEREDQDKIMSEFPKQVTDQIFTAIEQSGAEDYSTNVTRDSVIGSMLTMLLPLLLFFALIMFVFSRMQGGRGGLFGMGMGQAKDYVKETPTTTFKDVAGADEAVEELYEIKDFLENPGRYQALGAKIPRGVLLYGPPGTGKTLLARAVAGEAGVPFYSMSGSDFVEMFVGVGASRVRDLFKQAKENSPCIVFVDEIDAVGRQRGGNATGGHDEREQTLNQLLVEMDGFGDREGVIIMAATNRPDILDPALLRPGRFDRQVPVSNPDLAGRRAILKVHSEGKPMGPDANLDNLAKRTAGMSGADLANVINEAALLTARVGGTIITADALEEATDRVVGGPRRKSKVISEQEKKITAYHEGGHTLAAWAMPDIEPIYKVTILARGRTGGHAMIAGEDDKGMLNRSELFSRIVFAMGGRAAEELVFGQPTTGASNDIEQATKIARAMVCEYGMAPAIGAVKYGEEQGDPFARGGAGGVLGYSPEVGATIDAQVRHIVELAHREAYTILSTHRDKLDELASQLLERETLRRGELEKIFGEIETQPRKELFPGEPVDYPRSTKDPVKTPGELAKERGEPWPPKVAAPEAVPVALPAAEHPEQATSDAPVVPPRATTPPAAPESNYPVTGGDDFAQRPGRPWSQPTPQPPRAWGTPPPAGWQAAGSAGSAVQPEQPGQPQQDQEPRGFQLPEHERPDYSAWDRPQAAPAEPTPATPPTEQGEQQPRGFRLPEHERPDYSVWDDAEDTARPAGDAAEAAAPETETDQTRQLPAQPTDPTEGDRGRE